MIPVFCHKATLYDPENRKHVLTGRLIEEKLDGVGCQVVFNDGSVQIYGISKAKVAGEFSNFTRKIPHISSELQEFQDFEGIIQGELVTDYVPEGGDRVGYVTGILHADDGLERQKNHKLRFVAYELPSDHGNYTARYARLQYLFSGMDFKYCSLNPILGINDSENLELEKYFNEIVNQGGEGLVLYDPLCKYKRSDVRCQRNVGLIKIKAENEGEALCLEMNEGTGKFKGTLGSLTCIDGSGREFNIGSFSIPNEQRDWIWQNMKPPFVVDMLYFMQTDGSYKLSRFKRVRPDKNISDWNFKTE